MLLLRVTVPNLMILGQLPYERNYGDSCRELFTPPLGVDTPY